MRKIGVGIVGLGFMGTTHFRIYKGLPGVRVVAVADVDPAKRAGDVSAVVGNIGGGDNSVPLDLEGVKAYADAAELIAAADVDVVDSCAPTVEHKRLAVLALRNGKHVMCEKPVCRSIKELDELVAEVKAAKGFFNVGMCVRAWPEYRHFKELYSSGTLGKVRSATFRRLSPDISGNGWDDWFMDSKRSGGALLDLHLHDADFVRHVFGRPEAVSSFGAKGVRSDGVDHVLSVYRYADGALVTAEGGWAASRKVGFEMSFQVICEKATVRLAGEGYKIYWEDGRVESPAVADPALPTGWHQELAYFIACVRDGVKPDKYQSVDDVADSLRIVLAEQESVDAGRSVALQY